MVKVKDVTKYYGSNLAISKVSFEAKKNEIIGLLGKNGAGKTTTLNIITGYISSTEGTVEIDGYDILGDAQKAKSRIGYLPEKPPIYMDMTVDEYLDFCAHLKGIDKELRKKHIEEICSVVGINDVRKRLCKNLSKGYTQRVGLGQALVGNPEILILDEPTIGLDPKQIIEIRELIKALGKNHTIIISSHVLGEIAQICERIIILDEGKVAASDTLANLTNSISERQMMRIRIKGEDESILTGIEKLEGIISVKSIEKTVKKNIDFMVAYKKQSNAIENIFNYVVENEKVILIMKPIETTLEDVFMNVVNASGRGK